MPWSEQDNASAVELDELLMVHARVNQFRAEQRA